MEEKKEFLIGDEVFFMSCNLPKAKKVEGIITIEGKASFGQTYGSSTNVESEKNDSVVLYNIGELDMYPSDMLFLSKEELMKSVFDLEPEF